MSIQEVERQTNRIAVGVKTEGYIRCGTAHERFLNDTETTGGIMILNRREDEKTCKDRNLFWLNLYGCKRIKQKC